MNKKAFTLLELLIVVLIIGILATIALPQYKRAVERSKMAEAVTMVKTIAQAQQRYYMIHGKYLVCMEGINSLDINLPGKDATYNAQCPCRETANFMYMSSDMSGSLVAMAQRTPLYKYFVYIAKDQNRIRCHYTGTLDYQPTQIQKELCDKLNETGTL